MKSIACVAPALKPTDRVGLDHSGEDHEEAYKLGLVRGHYFIRDTTNITSCCFCIFSNSPQ